MMEPDFLLIQKMKLGDDSAIEAFIHKYYAKIFQYCHLHIKDRGYAEDMTQETFEKFFRSLDTYRHYGKALNYLYVLAANTCKDYYKKTHELCLEEIPEGTSPDLTRIDEQVMIESALDRLPPELRETIHSARLLIFAGVDLFLLSLFFAMTAVSGVFLTLNFMIDFFIPFNITCCICFRALCSPHICSETLTMALCIVWIAVWLLILLDQRIYGRIALPVWGGLLFFSFLYLVYCIRRSAKNYNLIWEAGTPWN